MPFMTRRRRKRDALAHGALIEIAVSLRPGTASANGMLKPMTEAEAIAYDNDLVLLLTA
jgi:hypothetical protein